MTPWLKISFDPCLPGMASVSNFPRKRRKIVPGQWFVFDKNQGVGETPLFASGDINDCHRYVEEKRP